MHLSALVLLRDHFTGSNVDELVAATSGKTKREIQELLVRRAPRPDVPATIRKLRETSTVRCTMQATLAAAQLPPLPAATPPAPPARVEPLSESRYKLQLTIGRVAREKLERATDLMRHRNPSGDLAVVVEQALDALLAKLERERLAKTSRPRRVAGPTKQGRIAAAVRREVVTRDGERCTYVSEDGLRCTSSAFLELDHVTPRALGGRDAPDNLRVVCRAHNRLHAEEVLGRKCVERGIHVRQRKSDALAAATRDLVNLGFREQEARRAVGVVASGRAEEPALPDMLRAALALLTLTARG